MTISPPRSFDSGADGASFEPDVGDASFGFHPDDALLDLRAEEAHVGLDGFEAHDAHFDHGDGAAPFDSHAGEAPEEERRSLGSLLAEHLAELEAERAAADDEAHFDDLVYSPAEPAGETVAEAESVALWPRPAGVPDRHEDHVAVLRLGRSSPVMPAASPPAFSLAELAERVGDDVVDAADVVAELAQHGVDDDVSARRQYGMSLHGVGVSVLTHLQTNRAQRGIRRAPAKRPYLVAALLRCALYLGPLSVAVAAAPSLHQLHPLVPAVILLLGWSAAQALTSVGATVAQQAGPAAAARLAGGGFLTAGGVWGALVWVAPASMLGGHRMAALAVGLGGLTTLATVTAALVTRTEADVVRWSLPCWLLGALTIAGALSDGPLLPVDTLLPAAIVVAAVRAYRPVIMRRVPDRPRLTRRDAGRGVGHLVLGAAQAGCLLLLWRAGSGLAALPLLIAVPALETLVGWHLYQVAAGLDLAECERDYREHVRSVAVATVSALLPPLAAGIALAAAAYRLPYGVATRDGVLALAAGTLLGGLLAISFLVAARGRIALAAFLAAAAPLAVVAWPALPIPRLAPLPALVAALAAIHLLGLFVVAITAAQIRRPS
jgi:hypothetical protein